MNERPVAKVNTRCHRCGGELGFGKVPLTRMDPALEKLVLTDPAKAMKSLEVVLARLPDSFDIFCQTCREPSPGFFPTARSPSRQESGDRGSAAPVRSLFWPGEDDGSEIAVGIDGLIDSVTFLVYGLKGRPGGLEYGYSGLVKRGREGQVRLRYTGVGEDGVQRGVELRQGRGVLGDDPDDRLTEELGIIAELVWDVGRERLRREYLRSGNIHRDWNLARLGLAERKVVTLRVNGGPLEVEVASWLEPEPVVVARLAPDGHPIVAAAVGMTRVGLLGALRGLAVLQRGGTA